MSRVAPSIPGVAEAAGAAAKLPFAAGGRLLGVTFGAVAAMRGRKPLHPRGVILAGVLTRSGSAPPVGQDWLDGEGADSALVRFSRSVGFPAWAPDVLGLAVRLPGQGRPADLLLGTTGRGAIGRRLLMPRRHPGTGTYGALLPYESDGRLLDLAAEPVGHRRLPAGIADMVAALSAQPLELRMLVAPAGGGWRQFGLLSVGGQVSEVGDGDVRFDPVLNPLPGLEFPRWVRELREPAYASARNRA